MQGGEGGPAEETKTGDFNNIRNENGSGTARTEKGRILQIPSPVAEEGKAAMRRGGRVGVRGLRKGNRASVSAARKTK